MQVISAGPAINTSAGMQTRRCQSFWADTNADGQGKRVEKDRVIKD